MNISSIEWLFDKIKMLDVEFEWEQLDVKSFRIEIDKAFEQAKQLHKQEIIDAYLFGIDDIIAENSALQYYNETYAKLD